MEVIQITLLLNGFQCNKMYMHVCILYVYVCFCVFLCACIHVRAMVCIFAMNFLSTISSIYCMFY